MKLATWNVNSIRARQERLLAWLQRVQPDVVCLQELKGTDDTFPYDAILAAGYHAAVLGQKTYNGVAILSKTEPAGIVRGLQDTLDDPLARLISTEIGGVRILSAYFPNGQAVGTEQYLLKLAWMERLREHLQQRYRASDPLVLCGDFNVAPDDADVARPAAWANSVLCHGESRAALERLRQWGLVDVFRQQHPQGGQYSWWDYQRLAFPKNDGLRIDHLFATRPLAARCRSAAIDRQERKGPKPSDHAPVVAEFDWPST